MSLINTVRNTLVPVHKEGYRFIAIFFVVSLVLGFLWEPLMWIGFILTAWCAYFFRDPERMTPLDDDLVISPADGRVSSIAMMTPPEELGLGTVPMLRITVFMNVFNCHVNRAPVRGTIRRIAYRAGKFVNAELDKASHENERNGLVIETAFEGQTNARKPGADGQHRDHIGHQQPQRNFPQAWPARFIVAVRAVRVKRRKGRFHDLLLFR